MRNFMIFAALAAGLATAANATTTTHHRHARTDSGKADGGSAAVRELNEKSLQQASAGTSATTPPASGQAMSDSGAQAPMTDTSSAAGNAPVQTPTDGTPNSPTVPQ